jgi:hypothetical protein
MNLTEKARIAAFTYVECINTKNLQRLLALFADNGRLVHPYGLFEGKEKLAEFYGGLVMLADTQLSVGRMTAEGSIATLEVVGVSPQAPDKAQYAIDLFQIDDEGLISELAIYYRNTDMR